ncbi:MAG: HK97-gp10 family putative phage morphogenesis protein [Bacteroidia bacterium]
MAFKGIQGQNNKFELQGFDGFIKAVQTMPDKMKSKAMREIIAKNMKPISEAIKANTPVRKSTSYQGSIKRKRKDGSISTESMPMNLKKSIGVKTFGKGTEISGYAGIQKKKNDGWYGFFIERGTRNISKDPFIARAAAATVPLATEHLTTDIKDYIVNNAQKLGLDAK